MVSLALPSGIKILPFVISDKSLLTDKTAMSFPISNRLLPVDFSNITICTHITVHMLREQ